MKLIILFNNLKRFVINSILIMYLSITLTANSLKTKSYSSHEKADTVGSFKMEKFLGLKNNSANEKRSQNIKNMKSLLSNKFQITKFSHSVDNWSDFKDFSELLIFKCKNKKHFALTWDDGPKNKLTHGILDLLKLKKVTGTFFFIAERLKIKENAVAARRALKEGHQIASHTFNHKNLVSAVSNKKSCPELKHQVFDSDKIFREKIGVSPKFIRPPFGDITKEIAITLRNWNYYIALWNIDTYDWFWRGIKRLNIVKSYSDELKNKNPKFMMQDSYISLQHEHSMNIEATIERYSYIIDMIREKGFKLVDMAECIGKPNNKYFSSLDYNNKKCKFDKI